MPTPDQKRKYKRTYYAKHTDKVKKSLQNYRLKNPVRALLVRARARAKRTGEPFDLTEQDLVMPEQCPVLGIKLHVHANEGKRSWDDSPSLDRRVPTLGYVRGNVFVISCRANRIKNDATLEELRLLTAWMERTA